MNKVYSKKRSTNGQYYLEIWADDKGKDTRALTLNVKHTGEEQPLKHVPILDTDSQKIKLQKKSHNEKTERTAATYADVVACILYQIDLTSFFELIRKGQTIGQIQMVINQGIDPVEAMTLQEMKQMPFRDFTIWHIERTTGIKCKVGPTGKIITPDLANNTTVGNYVKAVNLFLTSVGYFLPSESISSLHMAGFLSICQEMDWKVREAKNGEMVAFIEEVMPILKAKTTLDPKLLTNYLHARGIRLKPSRGRKDEYIPVRSGVSGNIAIPGRREEITVKRIERAWWQYLGTPLPVHKINAEHLRNFGRYIELDGKKTEIYPAYLKNITDRAIEKYLLPDDIRYVEVKTNIQPNQRREHLTIEEFQTLYETPWRTQKTDYEIVRLAFLFACQVGLRWSDLQLIRWNMITCNNELNVPKQKKTSLPVRVPLNSLALEILDKVNAIRPRDQHETIFGEFPRQQQAINDAMPGWLRAAGITRRIVFHSSRHTFACHLIEAGVDGFMVSELLGHSDIKMVREYLKFSDRKRWETIEKLNPFGEVRKFNLNS